MSYPSPRFPEPPPTWTRAFMQEYTRVLIAWIAKIAATTDEEAGETAFRTLTASGLVGLGDGFILVDTTGGAVTVTLPDPSTVIGRQFMVKRTTAGANACTVVATTGNVEGAASFSVDIQYESNVFKSDGTNYWIVSTHYGP